MTKKNKNKQKKKIKKLKKDEKNENEKKCIGSSQSPRLHSVLDNQPNSSNLSKLQVLIIVTSDSTNQA